MRTERMMGRAFLLAALSLASPAPLVRAQEAPPEPPLPPAEAQEAERERVFTGDHTVAAGETVEDIVVVGGDLTVLGEVTGDAVVVGGDLILEETGSILGDAMVTGGEILQNGGRIRGEMRAVSGSMGEEISAEITREITEAEVEREVARSTRHEMDFDHRDWGDRRDSWFTPIRRGFAGLVSTLAFGLVLAGIGAALIFYGRPYLETVSDTLRTNALRSGAVGLAACFLIVPAFVVLVVALAVSIIGIPLLLVAVPLYPLAIAAATAMGLLAAAHAIGERTAEQTRRPLEMRFSNSYAYLFTGLGMMLVPLAAAHLIHMTGFLSFIGSLLQVVTWAVIWVAATAGLGAVILSRAGTRRTFVAQPPETTFDPDPLFDDEAAARGPNA